MLKLIGLICLLSPSLFAAAPAAGAYAKYAYNSQTRSGSVKAGSQTDSVVVVNSNDQSFQLRTDINVSGQVSQTALWNLSGNYFDNTENFIENCTQSGGRQESVIVPAGSFDTCHIVFKQPDDATVSQEVWLSAKVPLFIVKQVRVALDQMQITLELQEFDSKTK